MTSTTKGFVNVRPTRTGRLSRFRKFYRRLEHADPSNSDRLRELKRRLERPYRIVRTASVAVDRWSGPVVRATHVSRRRQWIGMVRLAVTDGFPPETYYRYRLFLPERWPRRRSFLHYLEHNRMLHELVERHCAPQARELDDKWSFHRWCTAHQLPTPRVVASFTHGRADEPFHPPPGVGLVAKPTLGRGGAGVTVWNAGPDGSYIGPDGLPWDVGRLAAEIGKLSAGGQYLLQERVANHARLAPITPGGLSTARIVTARPPGADPVVLSATYGFPIGDAAVDNFHAGGLCASIDLPTGRLGPAVLARPEACTSSFAHHPQTGARIEGTVLPHWAEVVELALRAHGHADEVPFVGWDLAITDGGPLILEANPEWDAAMPQVADGSPLGDTPYVEWLLEYLGPPPPGWAAWRGRIRGRAG